MGRGDSSLLKSTCCVCLQRTRVSSRHKVESPRTICNSSSGGHSMIIAWFLSSGSQSQWGLSSGSYEQNWVLAALQRSEFRETRAYRTSVNLSISSAQAPLSESPGHSSGVCLSQIPLSCGPEFPLTHHPRLLMTPGQPSQVTSKIPIWDG